MPPLNVIQEMIKNLRILIDTLGRLSELDPMWGHVDISGIESHIQFLQDSQQQKQH